MRIASIIAAGLLAAPAAAAAGTIQVPVSATFVVTGTVDPSIPVADDLHLFGGPVGLANAPFSETVTIDWTTGPWGHPSTFTGPGSFAITVNGHTFSENFPADLSIINTLFSGDDVRWITGLYDPGPAPYAYIEISSQVRRSPSQWLGVPGATEVFQDNTVTGTGGGYFAAAVVSGGHTLFERLDLLPTSISSTFTTTALDVPEPTTWTLLMLGLGGIGALLRRRRRTADAACPA